MTETFRVQKSVKYLGMAYTAIFVLALFGCSSIFFLKDPKEHGFNGEHSVAIVGGMGIAVCSTMLLGSIYLWAAYYVEHFDIDGTMLYVRSMFQNCRFDISELMCLKWRERPESGSIEFHLNNSKAVLALYGYGKSDRLRIIRALHGLVPPQLQQGWPLFCYRVALPLRGGKPPIAVSTPSANPCLITRRRYDVMLAFALPLSVAGAIVLWKWFDRWQFAVLPLLVIAAWLFLRYQVPREGRAEARVTSTSAGRAQLFGFVSIASAQSVMVGLAWLGFDKSIVCGTGLALILAAFPPLFYVLVKVDKERKLAEVEGAKSAPTEWERGVDKDGDLYCEPSAGGKTETPA